MTDVSERGQHTFREIHNQPMAWEQTLDLVDAEFDQLSHLSEGVDEWIFTGCGSAYNVSMTAAPIFQQFTGVLSRSAPAADLIYYPETVFDAHSRPVVILISRSGETSETVRAGRVAKSRGARTMSITCHPESSLATLTDETLDLSASNEKSVITTQSLTAMMLSVQAMSAVLGEKKDYLADLRQLSGLGVQALARAEELGRQLSDDATLNKFAFVGNGPFFGLAREAQLKVKESALLPSDSYPLFDFRHGPKSSVDASMLVTVLLSDAARTDEIAFADDMKKLGGRVLTLCDSADARVQAASDFVFEARSGLHEFARGVLYLLPIHFLAYYRSLARDLDPDNPVNLSYWVEM